VRLALSETKMQQRESRTKTRPISFRWLSKPLIAISGPWRFVFVKWCFCGRTQESGKAKGPLQRSFLRDWPWAYIGPWGVVWWRASGDEGEYGLS